MSWLYRNLTEIFRPGLAGDGAALTTLARGGYYSTQPQKGLTIMGLNINYFVNQNPALSNRSGPAFAQAQMQFAWLEQELEAAETRGDAVWLLGHQPPEPSIWIPGFFPRFLRIIDRFKALIKVSLFGHVHTDDFVVLRSCGQPAPPSSLAWKKTTGIKWCSGGDLEVGDVFGAGVDGLCPILPDGAKTSTEKVELCKRACVDRTACAGFTFYPDVSVNSTARELKEACHNQTNRNSSS